ncbi:MAG: ribosomal RNA small subunit methyltransferase A [Planctomycetes bacterium]|nr:ribosomal RNA small subunit methyltransferase A [Planctomycetota bacterium]
MQTKHQIQQLLAASAIGPNKRFGQNFLIDLNIMRFIIDTAAITIDDVVLEVGTGTGSLTEGLAEQAGKVITVEIDTKIAKIAKKQLADLENVEFINADVLHKKSSLNPDVLEAVKNARSNAKGRFMLVANLPYAAASPLMINLVTGKLFVESMYVTIQKEVAERMTAPPGSKHYGTLSIILSATGDIKIIKKLKPVVFWPAPKVDSAIVTYLRNSEKVNLIKDMSILSQIINLFMQHRRKMVKASTKFATGKLKNVTDWSGIFSKCQIKPTDRPGEITPQQYVNLANLCCDYLV